MRTIQSSAGSASSAASSSSLPAAAAVGHNRHAPFGNIPQPTNPPTFRGTTPSSISQQKPIPLVHPVLSILF